jgi:hypothetical protein
LPRINRDDLERLVDLVDDALTVQDVLRDQMTEDPGWQDYDDFTEALSEQTEVTVHLKRLRQKLKGET